MGDRPRLRPGSHPADHEIARLAGPAYLALVAEPLFLLADTAIVARLGTPQLAGLGIAGTLLTTAVSLSVFLAYGTTAAVARSFGAGDRRRAMQQAIDGCWLALIVGVATLLFVWPLAGPLVGLFGPEPDVAGHAVTYLRISLLGLPAMLVVLAATGVLRGMLDTRTPMVVAIAGAAANVALNALLVLGLGYGIGGSALGTVLAQTGMAAAFLRRVVPAARAEQVPLRPDLAGIRRSFGAGVPLLIRTATLRLVLVLATAVAAGIGTVALAAHQVVLTIWLFLALSLDAIAIAAQAMVGRALGAADAAAARSTSARMVWWGVVGGAVLGVLVVAAAPVYLPLLVPDEAVARVAFGALVVAALMQPVCGVAFVLDGVLIGAGDGRFLAVASVISTAVFLVAATVVVATGAGLVALWWAITAWLVVRAVTLSLRARGSGWLVLGAAP
jgi:putative MATE family efflux protein